jgi:hypothetical protein
MTMTSILDVCRLYLEHAPAGLAAGAAPRAEGLPKDVREALAVMESFVHAPAAAIYPDLEAAVATLNAFHRPTTAPAAAPAPHAPPIAAPTRPTTAPITAPRPVTPAPPAVIVPAPPPAPTAATPPAPTAATPPVPAAPPSRRLSRSEVYSQSEIVQLTPNPAFAEMQAAALIPPGPDAQDLNLDADEFTVRDDEGSPLGTIRSADDLFRFDPLPGDASPAETLLGDIAAPRRPTSEIRRAIAADHAPPGYPFRAAIHLLDGEVQRGFLATENPGGARLTLCEGPGVRHEVDLSEVKAVFFLASGPMAEVGTEGEPVTVVFEDGRELHGYSTDVVDAQRGLTQGFTLLPHSHADHWTQAWVARRAVAEVLPGA